jgi:replicative DNA helicase
MSTNYDDNNHQNPSTFMPSQTIYDLSHNPRSGYVLPRSANPPRACNIEKGLIGALLINNDLYYRDEVSTLEPSDFYSELNQEIWADFVHLISQGHRVDVMLLGTHMEIKGQFSNTGLSSYLVTLTLNMATPESLVNQYVDLIKEVSGLRQLCIGSMDIARKIIRHDPKDSHKDLVTLRDEAYKEFRAIFDKTSRAKDVFTYKDTKLCGGTFDDFLRNNASESDLLLPTPYDNLTDMLGGGFKPGGYYIIAARPSMGKTTLALNIVDHICKSKCERNHVLLLSMEMRADDLFQKSLVSETGERWEDMLAGSANDARWDNVRKKYEEIQQEWPLYIATPYKLTPKDLQQAARRTFKLSGGKLGLIVIDYIQLMSSTHSNSSTTNRAQEISEISRAIKGLANELDIPIIVLSQLNRNLEERQNRRPVLSDLRDSGALEQDADVVTFLYRKEVYTKDNEDKGDADLIIAKNRMGPIGYIKLKFEGQYSRFIPHVFEGPDSTYAETLADLFSVKSTTPKIDRISDIADTFGVFSAEHKPQTRVTPSQSAEQDIEIPLDIDSSKVEYLSNLSNHGIIDDQNVDIYRDDTEYIYTEDPDDFDQ